MKLPVATLHAALLSPRTLLIIFLLMAILMFSSALIELQLSRSELTHLMTEQAHSLIETLLITSRNALLSNERLDAAIRERLLNNANFVRMLYEQNRISNTLLTRLAEEQGLYRINIFNRYGEKIYYSHQQEHIDRYQRNNPQKILQPIFTGETDTLLIGIKPARFEDGYRFAVALAAVNRSAIVVNLDAGQILQFRKEIGYGNMLRSLVVNPGIVYVALQDSTGILAASPNVRRLEPVSGSPFLLSSLQDTVPGTRIYRFEEVDVFETVHPLFYKGRTVGLFRLGLSMEPLDEINARIIRRFGFISIILLFIGGILFSLVLIRQNLETTRKQYQVVETYSSKLIRSVSDAVIVLDEKNHIRIFNPAASKIFGKSESETIGRDFQSIVDCADCAAITSSVEQMKQVECRIGGKTKYLLTSRSRFRDENDEPNTILIIRDLTSLRQMEVQVQRNERLTAMGELASGVAHEIRNPLNTIGTIVQQLDKDFEPKESGAEYHELAGLVYNEVKRINETVQHFLRFSRPDPLYPEPFILSEMLKALKKQYQPLLESNGGSIAVQQKWDGEVVWDRKQMQQVFMNLIQNAADAGKTEVHISIAVHPLSDEEIEIAIVDDGPGIPAEILPRIFNLYFTTKANGTGIGLSIVQRIIYEHEGSINVNSVEGRGAEFLIRMPVRLQKN